MQITKGKSLITLPLRFIVYLCLSLAVIFLSGFLETTKTVHPENEVYYNAATYETDYQQNKKEIPGLKKQYMISGIVLLVIGLLLMARLYRSVQGVKLMPGQLVFFLDCFIILILAVFGFMGLDYFLAERYGTASIAGQEGLLGAFCYVPLVLIMPIVMSWQATRGILVTEQGVLSSDLTFQSFMDWAELDKMELMDDVEFSGRRRSFKVLFLHTVDEHAITMPGNMRSKAKKEIKMLLLKYVPDKWETEMKTQMRLW